MAYTVDSAEGRTLLALRAGAMTPGELNERFPAGHAAPRLQGQGLVAWDGEKPALPAAPFIPGAQPSAEDFQFCLWEDGTLGIVIGQEMLDLPPRATQRLVRFLGATEAA